MAKELSHVVERFLRYVKVDTQSVHNCTAIPTTEKQKDLARMLVKELEELGAADIRLDDAGYMRPFPQIAMSRRLSLAL